MSWLSNLLLAPSVNLPFKEAFKRLNCMDAGHQKSGAILVDKLWSEKHPHTDKDYVYTVNLMRCAKCTLIFQDCGLEYRHWKD